MNEVDLCYIVIIVAILLLDIETHQYFNIDKNC